ncbi:MAG TPA: hypothetical protein PKD00_11115, partial [Burkholderiales bacterium]|nr:hypothetical protein [Burkholderiales bacterium]
CGLTVDSISVDFNTGFIFALDATSGTHVNVVLNTTEGEIAMGCTEGIETYVISLEAANTLFSATSMKFILSDNAECSNSICEVTIPITFSMLEIPVTGDNTVYELQDIPLCTEDLSFGVVLAGPNSIIIDNETGNLTIPAQEIDGNGPGGVYIYYVTCDNIVTKFIILFMANPAGPVQMYSCDGATCIEDENGQYDHSSCYGNCQAEPIMYSCSGQSCVEDINGIYENSCGNNCCLGFQELVSYECIPFEFHGEVSDLNELTYSAANVILADGACGSTENYYSNYIECCTPTGTYLGYTCSFGNKTKWYSNVECGGTPFDAYPEEVLEDPDCLGASGLLFTLEYDDIADAPVSGSNVADWQAYFRLFNNQYALLTDVIINGNFVEIYGYNVTFQNFAHGVFAVTPCVPLKKVVFEPIFTNPESLVICCDSPSYLEQIDLSTFDNLTYINMVNLDISSLDLTVAPNFSFT